MKTGNTRTADQADRYRALASMEPGHEDREYGVEDVIVVPTVVASMEPGHEDREYPWPVPDGRLP